MSWPKAPDLDEVPGMSKVDSLLFALPHIQMVMKELEATKAGASKAKELESTVSMLTGGLGKALKAHVPSP